jgi:hypothetical protein
LQLNFWVNLIKILYSSLTEVISDKFAWIGSFSFSVSYSTVGFSGSMRASFYFESMIFGGSPSSFSCTSCFFSIAIISGLN